jgi:hypothetical protein
MAERRGFITEPEITDRAVLRAAPGAIRWANDGSAPWHSMTDQTLGTPIRNGSGP